MPQPPSPRILAYVVAGGAVGVFARSAIVESVAVAAQPWWTLGINIAGSLLLGVVVGCLGDRHSRARAFLGTGVLGGFTTYSAFAVQTALWLATPWLAVGLAAASLLGGVAGALAGLFVGRRIVDRPGQVERPESAE